MCAYVRVRVCMCARVCCKFVTSLTCVVHTAYLISHSAMDGCGRLWDLRSGKCILLMDGHLSGVLGIDFSPNGYVANICGLRLCT